MIHFKEFMGLIHILEQDTPMILGGLVIRTIKKGTKVIFEGKTSFGYSYSA